MVSSMRLRNNRNRIDRVEMREITSGRILRPEVHAREAVGGYILSSAVAVRVGASAAAARNDAATGSGLNSCLVVERGSRRKRGEIIAVYLDAGRCQSSRRHHPVKAE